jgi:serine/threonine protein kinase
MVKLADFGVAMKLSEAHVEDQDVVGSPYWIAPEIIEMSTPTTACDIWLVLVATLYSINLPNSDSKLLIIFVLTLTLVQECWLHCYRVVDRKTALFRFGTDGCTLSNCSR